MKLNKNWEEEEEACTGCGAAATGAEAEAEAGAGGERGEEERGREKAARERMDGVGWGEVGYGATFCSPVIHRVQTPVIHRVQTCGHALGKVKIGEKRIPGGGRGSVKQMERLSCAQLRASAPPTPPAT